MTRRFQKGLSAWEDGSVDFTEFTGRDEYQTLNVGTEKNRVRISVDGSGSGGSYSIPLSFDEISEVIKELNRAKRKVAKYNYNKVRAKIPRKGSRS